MPDDPPPRIVVHRDWPGTEYFFGDRIVRKQLFSFARAGPAIVKNLVWWNHEYVGIDQRATTQPSPNDGIHMLVISHVKNSMRLFSAFHEPPHMARTMYPLLG